MACSVVRLQTMRLIVIIWHYDWTSSAMEFDYPLWWLCELLVLQMVGAVH